ncbi:MAG TPA: hypothetical protein VK145_02360, partial [Candidatus Nanoarchaeia archaeon]|nr:hypothetical protein [Candidatus Nanoarchaeia archaeon]
QVMACDLMVAVVDERSTGLGMQIGVQVFGRRKPLLVVSHRYAVVTDMARGLRCPEVRFKCYQSLREVSGMVRDVLALIERGEPIGPPPTPVFLTEGEGGPLRETVPSLVG